MSNNPEVAAAIRIADKHLVGASADRRKALALDIAEAIIRHSGAIAGDAIRRACDSAIAKAKAKSAP